MEMLASKSGARGTHVRAASFVFGLALLSACGTTAAQQSAAGLESYDRGAQGQISAGSFSLDYDTARHMGQLNTGAGSFSLDYDTAQHIGRLAGLGE
jgi:hypothetical protein